MRGSLTPLPAAKPQAWIQSSLVCVPPPPFLLILCPLSPPFSGRQPSGDFEWQQRGRGGYGVQARAPSQQILVSGAEVGKYPLS